MTFAPCRKLTITVWVCFWTLNSIPLLLVLFFWGGGVVYLLLLRGIFTLTWASLELELLFVSLPTCWTCSVFILAGTITSWLNLNRHCFQEWFGYCMLFGFWINLSFSLKTLVGILIELCWLLDEFGKSYYFTILFSVTSWYHGQSLVLQCCLVIDDYLSGVVRLFLISLSFQGCFQGYGGIVP